jgi:hypothetical protein
VQGYGPPRRMKNIQSGIPLFIGFGGETTQPQLARRRLPQPFPAPHQSALSRAGSHRPRYRWSVTAGSRAAEDDLEAREERRLLAKEIDESAESPLGRVIQEQ